MTPITQLRNYFDADELARHLEEIRDRYCRNKKRPIENIIDNYCNLKEHRTYGALIRSLPTTEGFLFARQFTGAPTDDRVLPRALNYIICDSYGIGVYYK